MENIALRSVNKIMAVITATDKFMYFSSGQRAQWFHVFVSLVAYHITLRVIILGRQFIARPRSYVQP